MTVNNLTNIAGDPNFGADAISFRDALERVNRVKNLQEAQNLYQAAVAGGDDVLVKALTGMAGPRGWDDLTVAPTPAGAEATKARALLVNLLNVATGSPEQLATAQAFTDPRLTTEAVTDEQIAQVKASLTDISAQATGIITQLTTLATKATARAEGVWPQFDPNDSNQVARVGMAWQWNVLPLLAGGALPNWQQILDGLDLDGLMAVQKFAPAWITANTDDVMAVQQQSIDTVLAGVTAHTPGAVTDTNTATALQNALDTQAILTDAQRLATGLTSMKSARDASVLGMTVQNIAYGIGALTEINHPTPINNRIL